MIQHDFDTSKDLTKQTVPAFNTCRLSQHSKIPNHNIWDYNVMMTIIIIREQHFPFSSSPPSSFFLPSIHHFLVFHQ